MDALPNRTLGSAYCKLRPLATALFGEICSAETLAGEEPVAIKRLDLVACRTKQTVPALGQHRKSITVKEDVVFEMELMRRLGARDGAPGQEHVMPLRDAFVDEEQQLCMVLPLCEGDLFTQLSERGAFGQARARKLFLQLLHGLHFLHEEGIAHRDLSLENLLLLPAAQEQQGGHAEEHLLIADLGLAAEVDARKGNTCKGRVGKNFYIAPEAFREGAGGSDDGYDGKAADLWSAGVILFMMLSGVPPHDRPCAADDRFVYTKDGRLSEMLRCWGMLDQFGGDGGGGALELVQALMCVEPGARMGLREAMAHPWVVGDGTDLPWGGLPEAVPCAEEGPSEGGGPAEAAVVPTTAAAGSAAYPAAVPTTAAAGSAVDPAQQQQQVAGACSEPEEESSPELECEPSPLQREPDELVAAFLALDSMSLGAFRL